jgi:hypothetical protein
VTDQWVPGPPPVPPQWTNPLPPSNDWNNAEGCVAAPGPAIAEKILITGVPATVSSFYWQVSLNDGSAPPNFEINQLDGSGGFVSTAVQISPTEISFNEPVLLSRDPVEPMEAVTLEYLESHNFPDAPDNQTYGRTKGAWNLVVPASGGTFTGQTNLATGGAVTGGALLFAGNAVCSVPTIAQLQLGGGSLGQVPATDGNGNLSWITPVTGGPYLPIAGGTVTGSLTVNQVLTVQGSNSLVLNAANGNQRAILGQTSTLTRWQLQLGDGTSEGLNNTGSNFSLTAYATAGGFLGNWLTIARADGSTTFNGSGVTIQGGLAVNGLLALADLTHLAIYGGSAGQVLTTNGSGVLSWATPSGGGGGGIADAPNDGTAYARKSAAWSHLTHTDITDWTATLAPYALTTAIPAASTTTPLMDGTAAVGTGTTFARADHVHPSDTSRYAASNPSGYQTAAQVTAVLPVASSTLPQPSGVAAVGVGTTYARADHVHPTTAMGDNRLINGDMRIDQRWNGANTPVVTSTYTVDRWYYWQSLQAKTTWGRNLNAVAGPVGFPYYLGLQSSSAYAVLAADYFIFIQAIEADGISDFAFGSANAQPVTLSFWARSSLTGTFGGALQNYAATRSYPFTYSLPTANTWTKIAVTIPGDTAGAWVMNGNAGSVTLVFDLGSGTSNRGPAGAWATTSGNGYLGATGAVSVVGTNGATFYVTGVKLEIGSVATPYNRQSLAKSLADCQRYFCALTVYGTWFNGSVTNAVAYLAPGKFPVTMRAAPTVTLANTNANSFPASVGTAGTISPDTFLETRTASATGPSGFFGSAFNASAEL